MEVLRYNCRRYNLSKNEDRGSSVSVWHDNLVLFVIFWLTKNVLVSQNTLRKSGTSGKQSASSVYLIEQQWFPATVYCERSSDVLWLRLNEKRSLYDFQCDDFSPRLDPSGDPEQDHQDHVQPEEHATQHLDFDPFAEEDGSAAHPGEWRVPLPLLLRPQSGLLQLEESSEGAERSTGECRRQHQDGPPQWPSVSVISKTWGDTLPSQALL